MPKTYNSFVIRSWHLGAEECRILIEHVQTGEQARVLTLGAALDWLGQWADWQPGERQAREARLDEAETVRAKDDHGIE
jgi:hypothetical protein